MTAPGRAARAKGNRAEVAVAKWLRAHGWPEARTTRDARGGSQGGADITGVPGWSIEVKDRATLALGKWWDQTYAEAVATGTRPVLVVKQQRIADAGEWAAITVITPGLHAPIRDDASYADVLAAARVITDRSMWRIDGAGDQVEVCRLSRVRFGEWP